MRRFVPLAATALALLPHAAAAQSLDAGAPSGASGGPRLAFVFGAGLSTQPAYFGSDEADAGLSFGFELDVLRLGPLSFGSDEVGPVATGLGFRGSFRYVGERTDDEFDELAGLDDVDRTFELGGGLSYAQPWWEAFAVARFGLGGHESLVGEVGLDVIARPTDRLTLRAGPRLFLGSDDYAATYFGVTADEADGSAFPAYDAEGGLLSSGVELGANYRVTDAWGVAASARYDRYGGDAEESPITAEDDQWSASLLVTRRIDFAF